MKKLITLGSALAFTLIVSQPVLANDAPGGPAAPTTPAVTSGSDIGSWIFLALLALGTLGIIVFALRQQVSKLDKQREEQSVAYYRELARISSTLLAALIALMTFLLVVGVQNSIKGFTTELYTAIVLLGIVLVLYTVGNVVREAAAKGRVKALKSLSIVRGLQQLLFVGSIIAVVWFAISYGQLALNPPSAQPATTERQPQP